jgi:membrane-associated protease RseP (regulator of RpoE activity)
MRSFMRPTAVVFALSALALSALAQATQNTDQNQNTAQQTNPAVQNNTAPTAAPTQTTRPRVMQRTPSTIQDPANQTNRVQPNQRVVTQPNATTPQQPSTLRPPVRPVVPERRFQTNPIDLQNRTFIQTPGVQRGRAAFQVQQPLRGPDIGLWFARPSRSGLIISDVATTGPIARFGFLEGDRILTVNGQPVASEADFMRFLSSANPVEVVVFRNGRNQTIAIDPAFFTQESFAPVVEPLEQYGLVLDDRFNDRVVVWRVLPGTPAFYAGFRPGDVITELGGQTFTTPAQFAQAVVALPAGEVGLQVRRGNRTRDLLIDAPIVAQPTPHVTARPVTPGVPRVDLPDTDFSKKRAASGVTVPNSDELKTNQPLDPARPNLQGGERIPRANR